MLPIFAITAADSVVIVLEPKAVNDRLSVTLALLLVVVAYKYIVAGFLPIVPYLTLCDFYVLGCFFFLILCASPSPAPCRAVPCLTLLLQCSVRLQVAGSQRDCGRACFIC